MKDVMDLNVYTEALDFSNRVWIFCSKFSYFTKQIIGVQLVRSADSISANIAEGFGRFHFKENLHFRYYTRGSVEETKDWLRKAFHRNLISKEKEKILLKEITIISKKLNGYINSIKTRAYQK